MPSSESKKLLNVATDWNPLLVYIFIADLQFSETNKIKDLGLLTVLTM